jgi:8-oxo-dGTP diphosphatase
MVQVAAGLLLRCGRVLACQRAAGATHAGNWEFPGGKREGVETLPECLKRELREELEIEAVVGAPIWHTRHRYPGHAPVELFFFAVSDFRGPIVNRTFADVRWVRIGELSRLDFLAADRDLVDRIDCGELVLPTAPGER